MIVLYGEGFEKGTFEAHLQLVSLLSCVHLVSALKAWTEGVRGQPVTAGAVLLLYARRFFSLHKGDVQRWNQCLLRRASKSMGGNSRKLQNRNSDWV